MSNEERASPLDLLRAGVTQGKQRVQVHHLKNEQSQLDKRRTQAVVELGEQAWEQRVQHPDYSPTFAQLVKLEQQRTGLQSQLDELLTTISQQERLKGQLNEGFAARIDSVQAQKRATVARLSKVMSRKQAAEQRLGEGQEPNTAEIERLSGEQQAIQSEISQYESETTAIQDEQARTIRPIEEQLSQLQKQVRAIKEQTAALVSQMKPIIALLGERVLTVRPEAAQLAEPYQQIDALDHQLAQKAEQIATLEQQITTASPTAKRVFYLLVGTAGTLALVFGVLIVSALRGGEEDSTVDIEDFPAAIKELLPESYVSENERVTFRYPTDWTLQEVRQPGETINILHISNKPAGFSGKPNEIGIAISEPVYIMEKSKILDYSNASTQEVLEAYVRHEAGEEVLKYANPPLEVTLGDRPAVLWSFDLEEFDLIWLGFRSVDNMVNLMSIAVSNGEFEEFKPTVLAIAETFNYLAPSQNLDEPERTVQSYMIFVEQGDMDGALGLLCSTDRVMLAIFNELMNEANDNVVDAMELASTILSIAPAFSQMDTSNLYYETVFLDEEKGQAVVRVSGHVIITTNNGREAIRYSKFNILGRDWLKLDREDRVWKLCDS